MTLCRVKMFSAFLRKEVFSSSRVKESKTTVTARAKWFGDCCFVRPELLWLVTTRAEKTVWHGYGLHMNKYTDCAATNSRQKAIIYLWDRMPYNATSPKNSTVTKYQKCSPNWNKHTCTKGQAQPELLQLATRTENGKYKRAVMSLSY
jgi:hypothetical protein